MNKILLSSGSGITEGRRNEKLAGKRTNTFTNRWLASHQDTVRYTKGVKVPGDSLSQEVTLHVQPAPSSAEDGATIASGHPTMHCKVQGKSS
jgi:hypothetical protein